MKTATISKKEYIKIIKIQKGLEQKVTLLQKMVTELFRDRDEEVTPTYARKLDRISADMDQGKGTKFSSIKEMTLFLHTLRHE